MSRRHGQCVVNWLEAGGDRFLRESQPCVYEQFLLHVGATDVLRHYDVAISYWNSVQVILDSFFTSAQRAEMCHELIEEPIFVGREDFRPFLIQARAEIRAQETLALVEAVADTTLSLRSVS